MTDTSIGMYDRRQLFAILVSLASAGRDRSPEYRAALCDVARAVEIDEDSIDRVARLMVEHEA